MSGNDQDPPRPDREPRERDTVFDGRHAGSADSSSVPRESAEDGPAPQRIGRYAIRSVLGMGSFGAVYLAHDTQLDRKVALKVPRPGQFASALDKQAFVQEARAAAKLRHPALVTVYDVQQDGDDVFIVQEYIDGQDLSQWVRSRRPSMEHIVTLIKEVVEAVGCAHQQGLVHRDLKPANLLVDQQNRPHVTDFGLALSESTQRLRKGEVCGTPEYMSPEQIRGLSHVLDGRSDLWSVGVILYELLTKRRPFTGSSTAEIFEEVKRRDPKPPRQIKPELPAELERICLKCLEKRQTDRYASAIELLEDLESWSHQRATIGPVAEITGQQSPSEYSGSGSMPTGSQLGSSTAGYSLGGSGKGLAPSIVPKGLRSFDEHDADFFLKLLPGARDREGLPESVRFWKVRIEEVDPDKTFRVGLIYGPSGCGKSSLVKAGLLPRLASHVLPVYVEASSEDTEQRLLKQLRRRIPGIPAELTLSDMLAGIREGAWGEQYGKVVVVLDQFEQWLHAHRGQQDTELVQSLMHCDGGQLQCVLLVRDDFWVPASRFMYELEIRLLEGQNSALIDLFDPLHARKVLAAFGRAYGRLPERSADLSREQKAFLKRAVEGLSEDGKIICVRLALFADMLKGKPWTAATIAQVGGTEGLGVTFLEETFSAATAPAAHRYHQHAAQAVLQSLLPEPGSDIKGSRQSWDHLLGVSGYEQRPREFDDLIQILDSEIRLVTPTVPAASDVESRARVAGHAEEQAAEESAVPESKYYQLTHDYLVSSLRDWLTRKQQETRRGRAELRLAERAVLWNARPERRYLPSLAEFLRIWTFTRQKDWTRPQQAMMRRAGRLHLLRTCAAVLLLMAVGIATWAIRREVVDQQMAARAEGLVNTLVNAQTTQVPEICKQLREKARWTDPLLEQRLAQCDEDSLEKLHIVLALAHKDSRHVDYLLDHLLEADAARFPVIRDALANHSELVRERLWFVLTESDPDPGRQRLRAAGALAHFDPQSEKWSDVAREVAGELTTVNPALIGAWQDALRPIARQLVTPLGEIYTDDGQPELARSLATAVLTDYAQDDVAALASLVMNGDRTGFEELFPILARHAAAAVEQLQRGIDDDVEPEWDDLPLPPTWDHVAVETVHALEAAYGMVDERFAFCQDLLWERFDGVAHRLASAGYRPVRVQPYWHSDRILVSAVWARDGEKWRVDRDLTQEQLRQYQATGAVDGLLPCDVAAYQVTSGDGNDSTRYALLWSAATAADLECRIEFALDQERLGQRISELGQEGFAQLVIHVQTAEDGQRLYCGIWTSEQGYATTMVPAYGGWERMSMPQLDVGCTQIDGAAEMGYAGLWHLDPHVETRLISGRDPSEQLCECQTLIDDGFRPIGWAVASVGRPSRLETASLWQRPLVPDEQKERSAKRRANGAVALLRLHQPASVWPLLRNSKDPRTRSYLVDRIAPYGVDPELLRQQLAKERDVSVRRALIQGLGEFAKNSREPERRAGGTSLAEQLLQLYRQDPDPGVHAAAQWALKQLGCEAEVIAARAELATGERVRSRRWYVTRQGQHTMAVITSQEPFAMGAPLAEAVRFGAVRSRTDPLHQRQIGRTFALSMQEVTVAQFQAFRPEHRYSREFSQQLDAPINTITWYQAAEYCNWLSQQEGLPEDQWCYDPSQPFADGMQLYPDYLQRTGYRLPTEAEWEFACRAGTATARYYGETDELLSRYAWYGDNSKQRSLLEVGSLKPNDYGLFDMLGNSIEWCQERIRLYPTDRPLVEDIEQPEVVHDDNSRVLRGGSFYSPAAHVRSAYRSSFQAMYRGVVLGFRLARTCQ